MKVTVAVSCYNQEDTIAACIESIIAQDYADIEILVVDDRSTDKSVEVVKKVFAYHTEVSSQLIVHDINKGLSFVRNTCIQEARGNAIFFVDGDDTMVTNSLGLFCKKMKETHADVVCGSFRQIDEQGVVIREYIYPKAYIEDTYAFPIYIENHLMNKMWVPIDIWNKLYKLEWLRYNNIYCSTKYKFSEGFYFTFQVALHAQRILVLSDVTYNWVQMPTSESHRKITQSRLNTLLASLDAVSDLFVDYRKRHDDTNIPQGIFYLFSFFCLTSGFIRQVIFSERSMEDKLSYLKTIKRKFKENNIKWCHVVGIYNKISYLILISPFPYTLFKWYFRHIKNIVKTVRFFFIDDNSNSSLLNRVIIHH